MKTHLIDPNEELAERCASFGRYLPEDYLSAMEELSFDFDHPRYKHLHRTFDSDIIRGRVVIIGARSVPMVTVRHVWLARLAGAKNIVVKSPSPDETELIIEMLKGWKSFFRDCNVEVMEFPHEQMVDDFKHEVEIADHIVVYGGSEAVGYYRNKVEDFQEVHVYGPKFSFGVVEASADRKEDVVKDFVHYWGQGCLSPRFYFVLGSLEAFEAYTQLIERFWKQNYEDKFQQFAQKLPLEQQISIGSEASTRSIIGYTFAKAIDNKDLLKETEVRSGLGYFVRIDQIDQIAPFITLHKGLISSIATSFELDDKLLSTAIDAGVTRICKPGKMQLPEFFWYHDGHDEVSELEIRMNFE